MVVRYIPNGVLQQSTKLIEQHSSIVDQGIYDETFRHYKAMEPLDALTTGYIELVTNEFARGFCTDLFFQFSTGLFSFVFVATCKDDTISQQSKLFRNLSADTAIRSSYYGCAHLIFLLFS